MKKLATLGPKGTYSELAALKYIQQSDELYDIEYFSSIRLALDLIDNRCDVAVLPIENFSEGFVSIVLDFLINSDLYIVSEIILPIDFMLVTNSKDINEINNLFVQFVAKGQCSKYIEKLGNIHVITTESNIKSLELFLSEPNNSSAIVPSGAFDESQFNTVIGNINDYKNNQTRFLAVSKKRVEMKKNKSPSWKTSLVIMDGQDRPGILSEILVSFASRGINLTSIISRPNKIEFGGYNFLIDFSGHFEDIEVSDAISEISHIARVKNMGSYPAAKIFYRS